MFKKVDREVQILVKDLSTIQANQVYKATDVLESGFNTASFMSNDQNLNPLSFFRIPTNSVLPIDRA